MLIILHLYLDSSTRGITLSQYELNIFQKLSKHGTQVHTALFYKEEDQWLLLASTGVYFYVQISQSL